MKENNPIVFLAKRYYVTFGLWHELSMRLSSVTLLHPIGRNLNFSAIFLRHLIAQGLGQFVLKFCAKIGTGTRVPCKLNTRGMKK